jgi:hypothetical protein
LVERLLSTLQELPANIKRERGKAEQLAEVEANKKRRAFRATVHQE